MLRRAAGLATVCAALLAPLGAGPAASGGASTPPSALPRLPIEETVLDNGLRLLVAPRPRASMVAAGWVVAAGSADESPGATGVAHLLEHLMFKGTRTVGARDPERERALLAERDRLFEEIRELEARTGRRGAARRARRLEELRRSFDRLGREARSLAFLGELSLLYSEAGGIGLNAHTAEDFTLYFVRLPAEALELWFWLESDRLLAPVLRDFHREKEIVAEERRLRVGSTPTGRLEEEVRAAFWGRAPYGWPPLGRPRDLERLGRPEAERFLATGYRPERITAVLVGGVEPARAAALGRRYFGRLPAGSGSERETVPAPAAARGGSSDRNPAPSAPATREWRGVCDCPRQARVLYPAVPFRHPDSYPLEVLAGILGGRSGRLHRSLVLERGIAFTASAHQQALARAGSFVFLAEARGGTPAAELVAAWDRELARIVAEPIPERELARVRNQVAADALRRLRDPFDLLRHLLVYAGLGDWREIRERTARILAVEAGAVREAASRHLAPERRLVAIFERQGAPPEGRR